MESWIHPSGSDREEPRARTLSRSEVCPAAPGTALWWWNCPKRKCCIPTSNAVALNFVAQVGKLVHLHWCGCEVLRQTASRLLLSVYASFGLTDLRCRPLWGSYFHRWYGGPLLTHQRSIRTGFFRARRAGPHTRSHFIRCRSTKVPYQKSCPSIAETGGQLISGFPQSAQP